MLVKYIKEDMVSYYDPHEKILPSQKKLRHGTPRTNQMEVKHLQERPA
uniref:Uncharacterized protein n=1 Tax=Arundo donax TaxID=35708 RepID=A0A0A9FF22_ARUDO